MSDVDTRIEHKIDLILEKLGITDGTAAGQDDGSGTTMPGDVVDLTGWKIDVCVPSASDPTVAAEIGQPKLDHYREHDHFFLTDDGTGVVLRAHHGHPPTKGSHNPRTELREMTADGSDEVGWKAGSGTHRLTVVGQVDKLTAVRPHVVLAQVHGAHDDVTVFRLEGSKLWVTDGNTTHAHLVTDHFPLATRYTLTIEVEDGTARYRYNGTPVDFTLDVGGSGNYFKAGNYLQSNDQTAPSESVGAFSEVVLYDVRVEHGS